MHIFYNLAFLVAAWRWGDWKNWNRYYSTILFFIAGDLLYNFLTHDHPMWMYHSTFSTHTAVSLLIMAVAYPATVLIYLGNYPTGIVKRILWTLLWASLYLVIEFINLNYLKLISHHNGWSIWWSFLLDCILFIKLRLHYKNPLLAWAISLGIIAFFWNYFIPPDKIK
jgi:hypothetical protein